MSIPDGAQSIRLDTVKTEGDFNQNFLQNKNVKYDMEHNIFALKLENQTVVSITHLNGTALDGEALVNQTHNLRAINEILKILAPLGNRTREAVAKNSGDLHLTLTFNPTMSSVAIYDTEKQKQLSDYNFTSQVTGNTSDATQDTLNKTSTASLPLLNPALAETEKAKRESEEAAETLKGSPKKLSIRESGEENTKLSNLSKDGANALATDAELHIDNAKTNINVGENIRAWFEEEIQNRVRESGHTRDEIARTIAYIPLNKKHLLMLGARLNLLEKEVHVLFNNQKQWVPPTTLLDPQLVKLEIDNRLVHKQVMQKFSIDLYKEALPIIDQTELLPQTLRPNYQDTGDETELDQTSEKDTPPISITSIILSLFSPKSP